MKRKVDWYKLLGIKRKAVDEKINNENLNNMNNIDIIENKEKYKIYKYNPRLKFEKSINNLKIKFNNLKKKIPLLINEKNFSLISILSLDIKKEKNLIKNNVKNNEYSIKKVLNNKFNNSKFISNEDEDENTSN